VKSTDSESHDIPELCQMETPNFEPTENEDAKNTMYMLIFKENTRFKAKKADSIPGLRWN
jgi:hypothetical protein